MQSNTRISIDGNAGVSILMKSSNFVRSGPLRFKGDSKKETTASNTSKQTTKQETSDCSKDQDGWTNARSIQDAFGSVMVMLAESKPSIIVLQSPMDSMATLNTINLKEAEPTDSCQIFTIRPIAGSQVDTTANLSSLDGDSSNKDCIIGQRVQCSIRTAFGKYLSRNESGVISASRDAIGTNETWTLAFYPDGRCVFSLDEYLLAIDMSSDGRPLVRADSKDFDHSTAAFRLRYRPSSQRTNCNESAIVASTTDSLEDDLARKYGYRSNTNSIKRTLQSTDADDSLDHARKEGRLYEEMLNRRSKSKHDPFC